MEIKTLRIEDENYPKLLKEIDEPPKVLYIKGEIRKEEKCFAIVGTRRCSDYGKEIAFSIAYDLGRAGIAVTSGMALGIDTFAHQGTLEGSGRTIAVLGTGLDQPSIYPKVNIRLAQKIVEAGGALVSEYAPGVRGAQFTFPQRNRIISGLSLGVLVVEAKFGSGALITAAWAKKQGRKVFAVPGSVLSSNSKGCHFLIKQGAKLAETADDILEELNLPRLKKEKAEPRSPEEKLILTALEQGNLSVDAIIEKTKLPPQAVSAALSIMEIENKVKNLGGNVYALKG